MYANNTASPADPSRLDSAALSHRLSELSGHERAVQVEFLLHLEEFDRRRAYLEAGFGSLWNYLTRSLHYREGATHRRIRTMRVLRRFPEVAEALREGRLCLTTAALLEPIITEENAAELLARAAFKSKGEVEHLVVSLQPRSAPRDGLRKCANRAQATSAVSLPLAPRAPEMEVASESAVAAPAAATPVTAEPSSAAQVTVPADPPALVLVHEKRPTVRPVAADTYSLNVTVDAAFKRELDQLTQLLSHKVPSGDLAAVLRQAVQCALEKHGKRKGALEPARKRKSPPGPSAARATAAGSTAVGTRQPVSAEVRRKVWKRDEGCCAWTGPDGRRCGSKWKLELDHIHAAALGGPSTVENLRLTCAAHNRLHAEQTFGVAYMARFRRDTPQSGELAAPRGS